MASQLPLNDTTKIVLCCCVYEYNHVCVSFYQWPNRRGVVQPEGCCSNLHHRSSNTLQTLLRLLQEKSYTTSITPKNQQKKEVTQTLQCPPKASDLRSHVVPALGHWKTLACFLGETAVELPPRHHQVGAANRLGAVEAMHRIACVLRGRPTPQSALSPQCS